MNCSLNKQQVKELIKNYGSPLYIFHKEEFIQNYNNLLNAMRNIYQKYNIAYSYKTNYTPKIIELVKELGGLAEVVSEMEYELAKRIGYNATEIVYNGPVKGNTIFEHLINGGIINVDSLDELDTILDFASNNSNIIVKLAFRLNVDIEQGYISRFGIDAYEDKRDCELTKAIELCSKYKNIKIAGLHCHVGKSRSLKAWENRVRVMFSIIDRYFKNSKLEFIDFGSGMNSVMEPFLANQFSDNIPSFEDYAFIVANAMKEKYGNLPYEEQPKLYTEPGTTLISGCMSFLSTVKTIKNVKGKTYVTFDCSGGNMGDICHLKNLPTTIYHNDDILRNISNATFVGYTCLEHDHIYEDFNGELAIGDYVQFRNIGSYSNVFKPPFILPNCAMICLDKNNIELIKRKETIDDLFQTYIF